MPGRILPAHRRARTRRASVRCFFLLLPGCPAVRALFWISAALLTWAQVGYGVFLALLRRFGAPTYEIPAPSGIAPRVSLIVAAYREQDVIAAKVANALALA